MQNRQPLLTTHGIGKTYGENTVLEDIDIAVYPGEIIGLIGENGAGKSTLLKIISGVERPSAGDMRMNGAAYRPGDMLDANGRGVGMVFQEQSLINNLTVAQNIFLGREGAFKSPVGLIHWRRMNARAREILAEMGLSHIQPGARVYDLTFSMRQMVEITKVLDIIAGAEDKRALLLLDEPTTVLSDAEIRALFGRMRTLKERGFSIIFISHRLSEVLDITDRIYVFKDGRLTAEVPTKDADELMLYKKMVGRETGGEYYFSSLQTAPAEEVVLQVRDLCLFGAFKNVSFDLHRGEVLALCGVEGSGKEAVCAVLCGDEGLSSGSIRVGGEEKRFASPHQARAAGILSVPRDRRDEGIIGMLSISENISVDNYQKNARARIISNRRQNANARGWVKDVGIRCAGVQQRVSSLSGGNAQKVIFARVLDSGCPILILDHPTRGVDVGSKEDIYRLIRAITAKGVSVILLGDTLDESIGLAGRIIVMKDGLMQAAFDCPANNKPAEIDIVGKML